MKNFEKKFLALTFILALSACGTPRYPTLVQKTESTEKGQNFTAKEAKFNSFIEQKISIYQEQYNDLSQNYQRLVKNKKNENFDKQAQDLEQKISVLKDAINYSVRESGISAQDKKQLRELLAKSDRLLNNTKKTVEKNLQSTDTTVEQAQQAQAQTDRMHDLTPQQPLFGNKTSIEGENLLNSNKKPALTIKAATEYESALSTVIKAASNNQTLTAIEIINLTTPQDATQTGSLAYKIYKEIIELGAPEDKVSLSQKIDGELKESAILIYTR